MVIVIVIGVQHRHNLEHEMISQHASTGAARAQKVQNPLRAQPVKSNSERSAGLHLHYPRCIALARVNASCQHYTTPPPHLLWRAIKVSDGQQVTTEAPKRLTEAPPPDVRRTAAAEPF